MPIEQSTSAVARAVTPPSQLLSSLRRAVDPGSSNRIVTLLILANTLMLFCRPQELPGMGFLGSIRLPLLMALLPLFCWLPKAARTTESFQTRVMMIFLFVEAFRTFLGKMVFEEFVTNDFWQFQIWQDLAIQFCSLIFPMLIFMANGRSLRSLTRIWLLIGFYLSLYVITHGGVGPGGFLGDENDVGLALLVYMPFALALITEAKRNFTAKIRYFVLVGMLLMGVIATVSRGAFVGLVCVLAYFFWRSQKKIRTLLATAVLLAVVTPFLPPGYIGEIKSIKDTDSGTADIRKHYWKLARKVWLDPKNTLIGVGLGNVSFRMGEYETPEDLTNYPSSAGRAVHSIYFQLLPDLGIWGVLIVGAIVWRSFRTNRRLLKQLDQELRFLGRAPPETPADELVRVRRTLQEEFGFVKPLFLAINVGFIAIFSAGAFISVLYYPFIWFLGGLSATLEKYFTELLKFSNELRLSETTQAVTTP